MSIAGELAERIAGVTYDALPEDARHWAKVAILDTVGCTLAGATQTASTELSEGGSAVCTVQVRTAGLWSTFPAASVARTEKVRLPTARPE